MEQSQLLRAEPLVPHRDRMRLIDWVKSPTQRGLQAETTVTEAWPLNRDGRVSSIVCIELVAQAIAALSTWRRGEGARPRVGFIVGVKEAEFFSSSIPVMIKLSIQIEELYHIGGYAVFEGRVSPSTPQPEGRGLPSTRAQAEGLRVDPERRFLVPPSKAGLAFDPSSGRGCAAERVSSELASLCKAVIQVVEPEEEALSDLLISRMIDVRENKRENGGL